MKGVDFDDPQRNIAWLNLSFYDDRDFETLLKDDSSLLALSRDLSENSASNAHLSSARCLVNTEEGYQFVRGTVIDYLPDKEKFKFSWSDKRLIVPRIFLCFDAEDPYNYMDRVRKAFVCRIYADSLIKFGFYVKSMPIEHLSNISDDQKRKIYALVHRIKRFSKEDL
jgi:dynein heavy chain